MHSDRRQHPGSPRQVPRFAGPSCYGRAAKVPTLICCTSDRYVSADKLRRPRLNEGIRQSLRILVAYRESMSRNRTRSINSLNALVCSNALGVDACKKLTPVQIEEFSRWREREEKLSVGIARAEAFCLAKHILALEEQLTSNE